MERGMRESAAAVLAAIREMGGEAEVSCEVENGG